MCPLIGVALFVCLLVQPGTDLEFAAVKISEEYRDEPPQGLNDCGQSNQRPESDREDCVIVVVETHRFQAFEEGEAITAFFRFVGLTQVHRIVNNARRLLGTWTSQAVHHLADFHQRDYDVFTPYIGTIVPFQSILHCCIRGPPLPVIQRQPQSQAQPSNLAHRHSRKKNPQIVLVAQSEGFPGSKSSTRRQALGNFCYVFKRRYRRRPRTSIVF